MENLSGIPGTVGAAPIQNIGAYGVEVEKIILYVDTYDTKEKRERRFARDDCDFAYRDSIFKKTPNGQFVILRVSFVVGKKSNLNISYADLAEHFTGKKPKDPNEARSAVLAIRARKIPHPKDVPNAGSFFKNPLVSKDVATELRERFPGVKEYPTRGGVKISAAWLIDHVGGWKGVLQDGVFVCDTQPLVITHKGKATARAIDLFASAISDDINKKTRITLEREVRTVGDFS